MCPVFLAFSSSSGTLSESPAHILHTDKRSCFSLPCIAMSSDASDAPVFRLRYGDIELVIAEDALTHNAAPFTIITPSNDLDKVEDTALLAAFQTQFTRLEDLVPKSIPVLRAYATLIMFYRISKNPDVNLSHQQVKAGLMGENAEDTLLFIVAKLLRDDDTELRRYLQQPHILVSSLLKVKQEFIFGDGNVLRLFEQARAACSESSVERLTMKQFSALYQQMDPSAVSKAHSASQQRNEDGQEKEDIQEVKGNDGQEEDAEESKEEKEQPEANNSVTSSDGQPDSADQTQNPSASRSRSSSSSSSPNKTSAPVYRYSSSSSSSPRKRAKPTTHAECMNCHKKNRSSKLLLCDRVGCETACHYDCCVPPLSALPKGAWFCAMCKPLVKQALEEELSLVVQADNKDEKEDVSMEDDENEDQIEEISAEQWQQKQAQWQRDREQYEKALAAKDAEVEQLRAEVERFKRQRVERQEQAMEEERKEAPDQSSSLQEEDEQDEQKEPPVRKAANLTSSEPKKRVR